MKCKLLQFRASFLVLLFLTQVLPPFVARAQETTSLVKGVVHGANNQPLTDVSVIIRNSKTNFTSGTKTDTTGVFTTRVPAGGPYSFSFSSVGYEPQTLSGYALKEGTTFTLDVEMKATAAALDQVVVVGYGTQKKVSLTNAVSQIKGEDLTKRPVSNFQQALQGQAPGLTVLDVGGAPGRSNATMRVRGITTLNNSDALVIVDGIEQRISDINPDDIESVSILKDAASTAIYGSRAANGVILITTKRAKTGKVTVTYNGYYALQHTVNKPEMMDLESYMRAQVMAYKNAGANVPARFSEQSIQNWVNATDREKYPLPNVWYDVLFHTAPQWNNTFSVSGGNENFKARMSVRYMNQDGIIPNLENNIREIRVNTDYKVSDKINVSADANYRYNHSLTPVDINTVFDRVMHGSLWAVPKYADGTYGLSPQAHNPLMYAELGGTSHQITDFIMGNIKGDWNIIGGLKFSTQFGVRMDLTQQKNFANAYTNKDKNTNIVRTIANNTLTEVQNNIREYTLNNLLSYENKFGRHEVKGLVGYSEIGNTLRTLSAYRERFYNNDIQSLSQGANDGTRNNSGSDAEFGLRSFLGRVNYAFANKYLLEANARYDGSSRFTGNNQYSFFPSFSAGWRLSQEDFFSGLSPVLNELKLRGSWGKTGNQSVGLYSYYEALNQVAYTFGGTPVAGYRPITLANKNITWETTRQTDIGFDASIFRKLNITFDYYQKRTTGILLNLPIPGAIGFDAPPQNAGVVDNTGFELVLGYNNYIAKKVRYNISGNLAVNNNKVVSLAGTGPYIITTAAGGDIDPRFIIKEGLPINGHWGYLTAGLFQSQEEINRYPTYASNTKPGDVKYVDLNGDGKINADDMTMIGLSFPKYTFGLTSNFSYKGFDLNLLFQGAADVDTRLSGALAEMGINEGFTHKIYTNNYWTPENPNARFPRLV
ncbi:MAG: TonB-dependent receptor, partial [Flavisolibacter sp.]|nr:TonB-dependent receptor [Flavisolibacter sp.]